MSEQLSLFKNEPDKSLEVVQMSFVDKKYTCAEDLFYGFNHLYAITFSYGLGFIRKIAEYFDTVEILLGCEAMVKFDLKTIMAFQTKALKKIQENSDLIERASNGSLSFRVAKEMLSHEKLFILTKDTGETRIIWGSANFSSRSFSGHQRENIGIFENDQAAFEFYMDEFETLKEFCTDEITKEALYANLTDNPEEAIDVLPIFNEVKINKAGIILDDNTSNDEIVEFTYDIQSLSAKYASLIPKLQKQNGKTLITPIKVKELFRNHKNELQEQKIKQSAYPQFKINYEEGSAFFNNSPYNTDVDLLKVREDLVYIEEYFGGFDCFIGDTEQMKSKYFLLFNYLLLSPFIAKLRYEAYKNDFSTTLFPLYAVINGPKSAGKSAFLDTIHTIMFGQCLGGVDPTNFTKTGVMGYLHECTGVPLHIEDISRERFNKYTGEIVKYENGILREGLINHPVFIITSNEIDSIKPDFAKRVYYSSVDAQLTNVSAATMHKKVAELRKKISTSFYKEYFKRMFIKVNGLVDNINSFVLDEKNEDWKPDIFNISSNTIIEIYHDCGLEIPSFITTLKYEDYFGHNVIVEKIRNKIIFEWIHNKKAFKVLKKQNLLEYTAGERAYEAIRICDSLPEILQPRTSGLKVVVKLDEAQKFFGINFKKGLFY